MQLAKQILLVESVEPHAMLIKRAFDGGTFPSELTTVSTVREAQRLITERHWDLILSDLRLPDGMGTDLLDDHQLSFSAPIIILSTHGDQALAARAMDQGALDYVIKSAETLADMAHIAEHALREWSHLMDRIQADEALRESEGRYRMLAENSPDVICRFNPDHRFLYVNLALQRLLGRPVYEFTGKTCQELQLDEGLASFLNGRVGRAFRDARGSVANLDVSSKSGICSLNWRFIPEIGQDNQVETVLCIARDLTEHRETQEQLAMTEERYGVLFQAIQDGFARCELIRDRDGKVIDYRFLEVNPAFERLLDLSADQLVGDCASEVFDARDNHWLAHYERVVATGEQARFQHYMNESGMHLQVLAFQTEGDQFATLIEDVTDKVQLEERLRQSEKMQAIGQLAGGVAHDFNNQLACIMGFADLLRNRLDDKELLRFAEMIMNASKRSAELTKQLLAFARRGQYRAVSVEMHKLITEVVHMLEHSLNKKTQVESVCSSDDVYVKGDPNQLLNAMLNIAINGDAAMPDGGLLRFSTDTVELASGSELCEDDELAPGTYLRVSISDSGTGMDEELQKRIFEPFFTTKAPGEGTGMGLAAVYGTVKNHRGTIKVESRVGEGSVFHLYLPILASTDGVDADEEGSETISFSGEGCVLIVDDEEMVRSMAEALMVELGYHVVTAADGVEAVACYKQHAEQIDLVIMDMSMPGMSGREAYLEMRKVDSDVKVVLSSGYGLANDVQEALKEGVIDFIQKPFEVSHLMKVLSELK